MSGRVLAIVAAACVAAIAAPVAADVKTGVEAWSAGDFDRAVGEWRLPAQEGDADALFNLAQAYRLGRGVALDVARARELYAEAAQKGHVKAADNYGLLLFQQGEQQAAMPLIRAASDRGDPRAQYVLGLAHFNADYAEKDWLRAYALLTLSQSSGLPQARDALTQMDRYIPIKQRQEAQLVARELEEDATRRRAAELAAAELGASPVSDNAPIAGQPARLAEAAPAPQPAPIRTASAPSAVQQTRQPPTDTARTPRGKWAVQLGAFGVAGNAERLWQKLADHPALAGTSKALLPTGRVTRLLAQGFASQGEAGKACSQLKAQGQACLVTKSS